MGGIFDGNINARATAAMMIAMLLFACAWESFTNWLEAKVRKLVMAPSRRSRPAARLCILTNPRVAQCEDNKASREMLSKAFKELIILGFIAFCVRTALCPLAETACFSLNAGLWLRR